MILFDPKGVRETLTKIPLKSTSGMQQFQGGGHIFAAEGRKIHVPPTPSGCIDTLPTEVFRQKIYCQKKFWSKKKFLVKTQLKDEHFFWSIKVLVKKLFWHTKFLVKKIFG